MWKFFLLSKSLHEPINNNLNTINATPTVSLPSNTPVCPNCDTDISLLSEGIDSLERFFDTQLQNITQMSLVKSSSKGINTNNESDILIKSLQDTIRILKKELINKENSIKNLSIILKNITSNTYKVSPSNEESGNEPILKSNTDSENEIIHELPDVEFEQLQRRYQHLLDHSPNQPEQTTSNDQCSNESDLTKGYKVIELNKVSPPLYKVSSCEEQLSEILRKYHEEFLQKNLPIFLFLFDLSLLIVKILRAYN